MSNEAKINELADRRHALKAQSQELREQARLLKIEEDDLILADRRAEAKVQIERLAALSGRTPREEAEFWENRKYDRGDGNQDPGRAVYARLYLGKRGTARELT